MESRATAGKTAAAKLSQAKEGRTCWLLCLWKNVLVCLLAREADQYQNALQRAAITATSESSTVKHVVLVPA